MLHKSVVREEFAEQDIGRHQQEEVSESFFQGGSGQPTGEAYSGVEAGQGAGRESQQQGPGGGAGTRELGEEADEGVGGDDEEGGACGLTDRGVRQQYQGRYDEEAAAGAQQGGDQSGGRADQVEPERTGGG